jgi:hypothetical protein
MARSRRTACRRGLKHLVRMPKNAESKRIVRSRTHYIRLEIFAVFLPVAAEISSSADCSYRKSRVLIGVSSNPFSPLSRSSFVASRHGLQWLATRWTGLSPPVMRQRASTPTRASWLNQFEIWFSILERKSLRGTSFSSVKQLLEYIDAFIESYNANAAPFVWTKARVYQRRFKGRRISQL